MLHHKTVLNTRRQTVAELKSSVCVYLIGLSIFRTLCILGLFDVLDHLPKKGVTVVLVLGHQHFQHEPQAPAQTRAQVQ